MSSLRLVFILIFFFFHLFNNVMRVQFWTADSFCQPFEWSHSLLENALMQLVNQVDTQDIIIL